MNPSNLVHAGGALLALGICAWYVAQRPAADAHVLDTAQVPSKAVTARDARPGFYFDNAYVIESTPEAAALVVVAKQQLLANDYAGAEASYRKALTVDPAASALLSALGHAELLQGKEVSAEHDFRAALARNQTDVGALMGLASIMRSRGQSDSAAGLLQAVLVQNPGNRSALWCLGLVAGQLGRDDQAKWAFDRYLELYPEDEYVPAVRQQLEALRHEESASAGAGRGS